MSTPGEHPASAMDPFLSFSRGDAVAAEQLRTAFVAIRDHAKDPEVARGARQVLDGRRSVREVVAEPEFEAAMAQGITRFQDQWDQLDDDERRALLAEGDRERTEQATRLGVDAELAPLDTFAERHAVDRFLDRRP